MSPLLWSYQQQPWVSLLFGYISSDNEVAANVFYILLFISFFFPHLNSSDPNVAAIVELSAATLSVATIWTY